MTTSNESGKGYEKDGKEGLYTRRRASASTLAAKSGVISDLAASHVL